MPGLIGREKEYVIDCLDSNWISSKGKYLELFEKAFSSYIGVSRAVSTSNGTTALHLALLAMDIGPGDQVIVPSFTYVATANMVRLCGAEPVFADSEVETWNMDTDNLEALITPSTKAIMAVHLYGHPCDMDPIMEIAARHGLLVIEDASQANGALYKGRHCGSIGDIGTFSFFANKTITTGEGGMLVTNDDAYAAKAELLKNHGMDPERRYWYPVAGFNYRMTNLQAAIGLAQLENIDQHVGARIRLAGRYSQGLADVRGLVLPVEKEYAKHSYWLYSLLITPEFGRTRDEVMQVLSEQGIETRPFFHPMHELPPYTRTPKGLERAAMLSRMGINLPTYFSLSEEDTSYVITALKECGGH